MNVDREVARGSLASLSGKISFLQDHFVLYIFDVLCPILKLLYESSSIAAKYSIIEKHKIELLEFISKSEELS